MKHLLNKIGRNDPCFCGSGKKYKHCCINKKQPPTEPKFFPQKKIIERDHAYIIGMAKTSRLARRCLRQVAKMMKPGITGLEVDSFIYEYLKNHNAIPATLNYQGYPASCCISPNEVVCHGIPNDKKFQNGDIVNVDLTSILDGYHGDINETFYIGECSDEAKKIVEVSRECLKIGIAATRPYGNVGDIGAAIQAYAHSQQCSVVEKFVGHGIGKRFHQDPQIPHFGKKGTGPVILPGMFFTIEPMINLGTKHVKILKDNWTAITTDYRLTAQFEHTIYIGKNSVRVLTEETDETPLL